MVPNVVATFFPWRDWPNRVDVATGKPEALLSLYFPRMSIDTHGKVVVLLRRWLHISGGD